MTKIGRYDVLHELGHGAMGVVYAAEDPLIGRTVAIKTIRLTDAEGGDNREHLIQRLHREAQAAGVLSHSSIVTIYDIGEQGEEAYIVMEYVDGRSIEEMIASDALKHPGTYLPILRETAAAIDYAHGKGIVHRDVKPSNIMVCRDGAVKIADFGIAKLSKSTSLTQSGFVLGTPSYMSPEQAQGRIVDGRADQFSLAVVAFRIVTGRLPFEGSTLTALLTKILWEEPEYESAGMSPALQPAFKRALSKDPKERFPTCGDFVRGLEEVLAPGETGRTASMPSTTDQMAPPDASNAALLKSAAEAPKRKLLWIGSAGLVFLVLALVAIFTFKTDQKPVASVQTEEDLKIARTPSETIPETTAASEPVGEAMNSDADTVQQPTPAQPDSARSSASPPSPSALPDAFKEASPGAGVDQKEAQKAAAKEPPPSQPDRPKAAAKEAPPPQPDATKAAAKETSPSQPGVTKAAAADNSVSGQKESENAEVPLQSTSGSLTWSGQLGRNSILVISGGRASIGSIEGQFPGKPVKITVEPENLVIRQPPNETNGWNQVILYSGNRKYSSIEIRWRIVE